MLTLNQLLYDRQVLSLRSGTPIAITTQPIIDPNNLKIIGWWCQEISSKQDKVLLAEEMRDFSLQGIFVDDHANLSDPQDLVRLQHILSINYVLENKLVKTERKKLGKISEYCFNEGLYVQKLYVTQSIVKAFGVDTLIIDRTQIIEVTDSYIKVRDTNVRSSATSQHRALSPNPAAI